MRIVHREKHIKVQLILGMVCVVIRLEVDALYQSLVTGERTAMVKWQSAGEKVVLTNRKVPVYSVETHISNPNVHNRIHKSSPLIPILS
jgi:hypothetical protein